MDFDSLVQVTLRPAIGSMPVGQIITALFPYIFGAAGFLLLGYLVFGGYQVLVSQGDPKAVAAGKEKITHAFIGFVIIFLAFWIVIIVGRVLGLQGLTNVFGG